MIIPIFQVDAFTGKLFGGNPAAVCPLDSWLPDAVMQHIAAENNLAETAFIVQEEHGLRIRWFTPAVEVDLCGHATLASGHVLFSHLGFSASEIVFNSRSGPLKIKKNGQMLTLDFPADEIKPAGNQEISRLFVGVSEIWKGKSDYMLVFRTQEEIEALNPDFRLLKKINARGIIVTAPGNSCDFVSRFFAPQVGVDEDPVTGSAHTTLTVYWSERLKKKSLTARQLSARKGDLQCTWSGDRVEISGQCKTYLIGEIHLEEEGI